MFDHLFIDIAPEPADPGIVFGVVLFVIGLVILLAGALVTFLWLRKRSQNCQNRLRWRAGPVGMPMHRDSGRASREPHDFAACLKKTEPSVGAHHFTGYE